MAAPVKAWLGQAGENITRLNPVQHFYPQMGYAQIGDQAIPLHNAAAETVAMNASLAPTIPKNPQVMQTELPSLKKIRKYKRLHRTSRGVVMLMHGVSALSTAYVTGTMLLATITYFRTRDISSGNQPSPWPSQTSLWQTYMMIGASTATFVAACALLFVLCFTPKREAGFNTTLTVLHILTWIAVAVLYRLYENEQSLWGFSCGKSADEIQKSYAGKVNFDVLCTTQTSAWFVAIGKTAIKILFSFLAWVFNRKLQKAKKDVNGMMVA